MVNWVDWGLGMDWELESCMEWNLSVQSVHVNWVPHSCGNWVLGLWVDWGFELRCLRSLVDRACTLAVGACISFWWSCKFLVLSEPDLLLSRTDLSLVATVEGGA